MELSGTSIDPFLLKSMGLQIVYWEVDVAL